MTRTSRRSSSRLWQFVIGYAAVIGLIVWGCGVPGGGGTPTPSPSGSPTPTPSTSPTPTPSGSPTPTPTNSPTPTPTASPSPTPSSRPCPQVSCANDGDCSDGLFCNGSETCNTLTHSCVCTDAPCDPDTEECDEAEDDCVPIADPGCTRDQDCDSDQYCNENTGQCLPDFTASCVPGAGPCNIGNSSPGCNNPDCCEAVCTFDPTCCLIQWTQQCADLAFSTSACLANP